ncbi:MAG: U32 family peptidase [bacterium]|nr:U32 family peptidase [bacterium]
MKKPELLLPAGNMEKLEYAIKYGADAVYLGVPDFSLRAMRKGSIITSENLKEAVSLAHSLNAKAYLTINIFAYNNDIRNLPAFCEIVKDANPDSIILSDIGVFNVVRKRLPNIPIHISTQANSLNFETVKFWRDNGAKRVILARELPLTDVAEIKKEVSDIELESFVHGSQCVSYSGRCLLSDYMTNNERKANQGNCAQPCRWSYKLVEETRPNQYFEIEQTERGTHILSTKDLCLVKHIKELTEAGIDSFKVEGRTKSLYYVSAVAKAYRNAIDTYFEDNNADLSKYYEELLKVGNRGYTQGFYFGDNNSESYSYDVSKGLAGADFLCEFLGEEKDSYFKVKIKNKIIPDSTLEIITPKEQFSTKVLEIRTEDFELKPVGNTNDEVFIKFENSPIDYKYAIARTEGIMFINKKEASKTCPCAN